ncbi:hypothetical protein T12_12938 [Trichinella patagoniensis]|uniref:Uncharacterized protein n=1 Tax=Trichinella patagoniensis TaxID=990121 RepID=A0A0V1A0M8_9BILA|nr:hypothetical protein T12_12938 [Trichinella patagoniensis]
MKSVVVQSSSNNRLLLCNSDNTSVNVEIDKSYFSNRANNSNNKRPSLFFTASHRESCCNLSSEFYENKNTLKKVKDLLHLVMDVKGTDKKRTFGKANRSRQPQF